MNVIEKVEARGRHHGPNWPEDCDVYQRVSMTEWAAIKALVRAVENGTLAEAAECAVKLTGELVVRA